MSSACTTEINTIITSAGGFDTFKTQSDRTLNSVTDLSAIKTLQDRISGVTGCIGEKINSIGGTSTSISQTTRDIVKLQEELIAKREAASISKDRLSYMMDPSHNVSFYQSWFPMLKPLRPDTIPILIGVSTFVGGASIFYLSYSIIGLAAIFKYINVILAQFTISFWILLAITIGIGVYFNQRKTS